MNRSRRQLQLHDLATLAHAKVAVMHFEGSGGKYQMTLSAEQKQAIKDVIKAYGASGGSLG